MNNIRTDAKNKKQEYIKSKFVDVTKSMIISQGIFNVTVRKIAAATGYSYATVYHYFSDLNELFLETKMVMIRDMVLYCNEKMVKSSDPLQNIKFQNRIFVDYFLESPNIFEFFYAYKLGAQNETAMQALDLEKEYRNIYMPFVEKGAIRQPDVPVIARTITYSIFGMILIYLSNNGLPRDAVYQDMDNMIDLLLDGRE